MDVLPSESEAAKFAAVGAVVMAELFCQSNTRP